jgi:EAL domain-containing protein (putative c-di-GMP-specific phosphodiesterase class I)
LGILKIPPFIFHIKNLVFQFVRLIANNNHDSNKQWQDWYFDSLVNIGINSTIHQFSLQIALLPDTFTLMQETGLDGDRLVRERHEADRAREIAEAAQAALFTAPDRD